MYISFARPVVYLPLVYSYPIKPIASAVRSDCVRCPIRLRPPSNQIASAVRSDCVRNPIRLRPLSDGNSSTGTLYKRAEKMT